MKRLAAAALALAALAPVSALADGHMPNLEGREVVIVTENAYPPLQFVDPNTGQPAGWEYDAMEIIEEESTEDIEQAMAHDDGHHGEATAHAEEASHGEEGHGAEEAQSHLEHLLHQGQNRPWAAFFISAFFFLMVSVCVLVFYAIQWAAQAGWSIVLFRVMEGITAYILPGSILLFLFLLLSGLHMNHIYVWMAEGTFDAILDKANADTTRPYCDAVNPKFSTTKGIAGVMTPTDAPTISMLDIIGSVRTKSTLAAFSLRTCMLTAWI